MTKLYDSFLHYPYVQINLKANEGLVHHLYPATPTLLAFGPFLHTM
jgi:hypothetical protein